MATKTEVRPICGFCKSEINRLYDTDLHSYKDDITMFCCNSCGAVLGITKNK